MCRNLYCKVDDVATIKIPDSYEIDINKVWSILDAIKLFKATLPERIYINETSPYYEDLKHLAKDKEK